MLVIHLGSSDRTHTELVCFVRVLAMKICQLHETVVCRVSLIETIIQTDDLHFHRTNDSGGWNTLWFEYQTTFCCCCVLSTIAEKKPRTIYLFLFSVSNQFNSIWHSARQQCIPIAHKLDSFDVKETPKKRQRNTRITKRFSFFFLIERKIAQGDSRNKRFLLLGSFFLAETLLLFMI